ncbi:MAG: hypothetical protein NXY57DRAFT_1034397 [Lentinula lateritia]|uniref:Uncharacterized protein n=1 Tax=Lentinula lateritia TaxID=40482 RepID=A0ABQ8VYE9_9AGAR|nr:MAG: hypothetical protein NXY57DRAFT_1034397 [Lentinula lateritia]KAJ4500592.1 hypothetical protein C8R41DRAFT_863167 [Lentinula lateritia]
MAINLIEEVSTYLQNDSMKVKEQRTILFSTKILQSSPTLRHKVIVFQEKKIHNWDHLHPRATEIDALEENEAVQKIVSNGVQHCPTVQPKEKTTDSLRQIPFAFFSPPTVVDGGALSDCLHYHHKVGKVWVTARKLCQIKMVAVLGMLEKASNYEKWSETNQIAAVEQEIAAHCVSHHKYLFYAKLEFESGDVHAEKQHGTPGCVSVCIQRLGLEACVTPGLCFAFGRVFQNGR